MHSIINSNVIFRWTLIYFIQREYKHFYCIASQVVFDLTVYCTQEYIFRDKTISSNKTKMENLNFIYNSLETNLNRTENGERTNSITRVVLNQQQHC